MTNATIEPTPSASGNAANQRPRRLNRIGAVAGAAALAVTLAACGGDDDEAAATTTPTTVAAAITQPSVTVSASAAPPMTTAAPATTMPVMVTEGATVVVANASRVDGGAGRLSDRLALVEFTMGTPSDSSEGPLEVSKVYYNASVEGALPVAESVLATLGGSPIELLELPTPPPVGSGEIGDATVLVAMGNDIADVPLDELQGLVTTTTVATESDDTETTVDATATTGG